ncbi:uroporphyrinogen decarboxylase [Prolixibacter bellariivorans]|uniref:Uroporphyrinogen decarboxylase n=1 Tax=Prolixibacter bellariivorans TaxID=314319 RepID=A0A5M4B3A2_9BACT|nr:uroporphyrinogen decarboxylase [Prolixibacter bellariivorans]GET34157.1 uroporphyrinogen decarboxylase [Prolixibacter bellariivorans]
MQTNPTESILLRTLKGESTERPPVWFMRQAGRVLPSYLEIKKQYTFWQMMQNPEVAAQVTLLPVEDLGVDAAILFSDILVVPYAMGMGLDFTDAGPTFDEPLAFRENPINGLFDDPTKLDYIYAVIDEINRTKPAHIPLIGFCGAPLTVLLFMLQGLGRKGDFPDAIRFIYENRETTKQLIDALTDMSIEYIKGQIKHGIDVFQLFDTHAGLLPFDVYNELFLPPVRKIAQVVRDAGLPFIFFPKGIGTGIAKLTPEEADFLSVDWQTSLTNARKLVHPEIGLQGNVDPRLLFAPQEEIEKELKKYLRFGAENQNWIFNLGHGFMPGIPFENARFLADWAKNADWKRS